VIHPGIVGAAWLASILGAGWWSFGAGRDSELATQYRENAAAAAAIDAATSAAARAISKIEVKQVTIRRQLEKQIIEKPVFRDCRSGPEALQALNATPGIAASAPAR
jgi:hypothetical protein